VKDEILPRVNDYLMKVEITGNAEEIMQAIERKAHVVIPYDLPLPSEVEIKEKASAHGTLVLGPNCSTSFVDGEGFGVWNSLRRGPVGLVGTTSSGLRAISCLLNPIGISHSLFVGTRDLSQSVDGLGTFTAVRFLEEDEQTEVIVIVGIAPPSSVERKLTDLVKTLRKPCVLCMLGSKTPGEVKKYETIEETVCAVAGILGKKVRFHAPVEKILERESSQFAYGQKHIRGVYTGRFLCAEAQLVLERFGKTVYSNAPFNPRRRLADSNSSRGHSCVDMSATEISHGKHPALNPSLIGERIVRESKDLGLAVVVFDLELGNGAHPTPATELVPAVKDAKRRVEDTGGYLSVMASIIGTSGDPQGFEKQKKELERAGVVVLSTPTQAIQIAGSLVKKA